MVVLQAPVEIAHDVPLKPAKSRVSTGKKTSSNETKDFERVLNKSAKPSSEESIFEDHRAKPVNEDSEKSQENKTDLEREIEKIVADLGLAYFFVPIDRPHETLEIKLDDKSLGIKDILFRLDDVEEMLMKLGMPSEKIELLAAMSQDGSYIDLPTLLNFLNEKTKELDNIKIPEKIWKKLFRNAALKLENSASENKSSQNTAQIPRLEIAKKGEVSLQELKHILNQLQECQKASNNKVMSNSPKVQSNINPKQQLELSERAINLRTAIHSSCENSNSNPAPFEPVELNFNPGTKPTLDVKSTELKGIDIQKMEHVLKPEAIPVGNESTNFQHFTDQGESSLWSQMFFWETGLSTQTPAGINAPKTLPFYSASFTSQLATYIQKMMSEGVNRIVLHIEPPDMGMLIIRIRSNSNKISAKISVEHDEVKSNLEKNQQLLRQYLAEQGLTLEDFSVDVSQDGFQQALWERARDAAENAHRTTTDMTISTSPPGEPPISIIAEPGGTTFYYYA